MLVAQHSDRFARGAGDKPGASDSLVEIWHRLRRRDVHLRTCQNDPMMAQPVTVAVAAEQAHGESQPKSKAVRAGKRRRVEERGRTNGPVNFGYRLVDGARVVEPTEAGAWLHVRQMLRVLGIGLARAVAPRDRDQVGAPR